MKISPNAPHGMAFCLAACLLALLAPQPAQAEVDPAARALVEATAAKLQAAQTIKLTARHELDDAISFGTRLDQGPLVITVQRPNQIHVLQEAGDDTREMAFDGKEFCILHPHLKHHALVALEAGSIEAFADQADERFGFRPPVAELLSEDMAAQVFLHVESAKVVGVERVGWTRCDRIQLVQEGITGDLWIARKDGLPRRYRLTFHELEGNPSWDIRFSRWELDVPVDLSLFSRRPAEGSTPVEMLKSR